MRPSLSAALRVLCVSLTVFAAVQPAMAALSEISGPEAGVPIAAPAFPNTGALGLAPQGLTPSSTPDQAVESLLQAAATEQPTAQALEAFAADLSAIEASHGTSLSPAVAAKLRAALPALKAAAEAARQGQADRVALFMDGVARALAERSSTDDTAGSAVSGSDSSGVAALAKPTPRAEAAAAGAAAAAASASAPILEENASPLSSPAFRWLLATHTLMVLADNLFKSFLSLALLTSPGSQTLIGLIGALMMAPWLPLAAYAGRLTDRVSKSRMIKVFNSLAVPALGAAALTLTALPLHAALPFLFGTVFLMGTHSLFYGTAKDAVTKEYVPLAALPKAVGLISAAANLMIIAAYPLGGLLLAFLPPAAAVGAIAGVAALGLLASLRLPRTEAAGGESSTLLASLRDVRAGTPDVFRVLLGSGYFAFLGALAVTAIPNYGKDLLALTATQVSWMQAFAGLGIAMGAALAGSLSNGRSVLGFVTLGAIGIVFSSIALALVPAGPIGFGAALLALGASAGFFVIPLYSYLQERSQREETGRNVGLGNFTFGVGAFLGSAAFAGLGAAGLTPAAGFAVLAALTAVVGGYLLVRFPGDAARAVVAVFTKGFYRVQPHGVESIPRQGGFVLAGNHVTWIDGFWLGAVVPRNVRFLMSRVLASWIPRLAAMLKIIPLSKENPGEALAKGDAELAAGHAVGHFPEQEITRSGQMLGFDAPVLEALSRKHPTVPFFVDAAWGSIFSFSGGRFFWKRIKSLPYHLSVWFGPALPPAASAQDVRYAVMDLGEKAMRERLSTKPTLARAFLSQAKKHWSRLALVDSTRVMNYGRTLVAAIMLSQTLQSRLPAAKNVAVLIPPTAGAGLANLALTAAGKVPVNLNFVTNKENLQGSLEALDKTLKKGDIDAIVTSKKILERFKIPEKPNMIFIEDLVHESIDAHPIKTKALYVAARILPAWLLERRYFSRASRDIDDTATILFTTGSTGDPKGVELTHLNLWANVEAVSSLYNLTDKDRVMNALPFFHAFGLTAGLWMPMLLGLGAVQNASPLEYKTVGSLIEKYKATIFPMIPSQLTSYMKAVPAEQMKSLRFTIGGAEKLWPEVAREWEKLYGSPVLEGYGATELAPVATVNVPDVLDGLVQQAGRKEGSVGRPIPGVTIRLVDPDNPDPGKPVPAGKEGLLLVKGPGVMKGYYKDRERTAEVLKDGWYDTADIFTMDKDGFLFFVDRQDGIAKIKGEKVPRVAVEEALHAAAGRTERTFIVVNVKDDRTGQKLVVLHTKIDKTPEQLRQAMLAAGVVRIRVPDAENFFEVDSLPLVGIGKANYKAARVIAQERLDAQGRK